MDLIDEIHAVGRTVGLGVLPAGPARLVTLARVYDADLAEVWGAITTRDELSTWFLPIAGDLEHGGHFELVGHAAGEIRRCDAPHRLELTWLFSPASSGEDSSLVEVRLSPIGGRTRLHLEHVAVVPEEAWRQFGPGAVGVGWDLTLLALAGYLAGAFIGTVAELSVDPGMRDVMAASSEAWGRAHCDAGAIPRDVNAEVAATTAFYVPPLEA